MKTLVLILASASKARSKLLKQVNIAHTVILSEFDENTVHESNSSKLVQSLAIAKAKSVASKLTLSQSSLKPEILNSKAILACDSVFEFEGQIFGKPLNKKQALERWINISGKWGILYTGHAILLKEFRKDNSKKLIFSSEIKEVISTKIKFCCLTKDEIEAYVSTREPFECAGGFAIEGRAGMFIDRIEGCYSNVIGLSLPWVRKILL